MPECFDESSIAEIVHLHETGHSPNHVAGYRPQLSSPDHMDESKHSNVLLVSQPHERFESRAIGGDAPFLRFVATERYGKPALFGQLQEAKHIRILCDSQSTELISHGYSFAEAELQGEEPGFLFNRKVEEHAAENGEVISAVEDYLSFPGVHTVDDIVLAIAVRDFDGVCDHRVVVCRNLRSTSRVEQALNLRTDLEILIVEPHVLLVLVGALEIVVIHD